MPDTPIEWVSQPTNGFDSNCLDFQNVSHRGEAFSHNSLGERETMDQYLWYAIRVRRQHEAIASQSLRSRGLEEFLPLYESRRRWTDRVKVVKLPLFTGYVFCRFPVSQRALVLSAAGCIQILKFGVEFTAIPDAD